MLYNQMGNNEMEFMQVRAAQCGMELSMTLQSTCKSNTSPSGNLGRALFESLLIPPFPQ